MVNCRRRRRRTRKRKLRGGRRHRTRRTRRRRRRTRRRRRHKTHRKGGRKARRKTRLRGGTHLGCLKSCVNDSLTTRPGRKRGPGRPCCANPDYPLVGSGGTCGSHDGKVGDGGNCDPTKCAEYAGPACTLPGEAAPAEKEPVTRTGKGGGRRHKTLRRRR